MWRNGHRCPGPELRRSCSVAILSLSDMRYDDRNPVTGRISGKVLQLSLI